MELKCNEVDLLEEQVAIIEECIEKLDVALTVFNQQIGRPEFNAETGLERFRYKTPTPRIFQVLKCVRVVSGLRACLCLLEQGFTQEGGVLIRTIYEFLHDIDFIEQGIIQNQFTPAQQEMLDLFFEHDLQRGEEMVKDHAKRPTVGRKKVYALTARYLKPEDPDRMQRLEKTIEEAFSGYVHGAYPAIMELYAGGTWQFHANGMLDTPRIPSFLRAVAGVAHHALNQFAELAQSPGFKDLFTQLRDQRIKLESSAAYVRPRNDDNE
jgi:hypothetical protein